MGSWTKLVGVYDHYYAIHSLNNNTTFNNYNHTHLLASVKIKHHFAREHHFAWAKYPEG